MTLKLVREKSARSGDKSNADKILSKLNDRQKEAVIHESGPLLIVAGAGSGKTRVLTFRLAYLVSNGVPPWKILALTFTNKAANEMKQRISEMVAPEAAQKVWAGTFHSIFARILRREAQALGYTGSFSIYDTDDSQSAIKKIINRLGLDPQQYAPAKVRSSISKAKNKMITWAGLKEQAYNSYEEVVADVFKEYDEALRSQNAMDFDDILLNFNRLLENSSEILEKYNNYFDHILVDEYQDTNRAQYKAIKLLSQKKKNVCAVGDDAQSIYRWRGADIKNILDFQKDYPEAKIVRLEQNYRSTKTILAAADSVIKRNTRQIPKTLWTDNVDGELIETIECGDDRDEAAKIAEIVKDQISGDYDEKDCAVLYRTNAQSLALENAFRRVKIPYVILGGMTFYKRKEVKDALAYMRILINPRDAESLLRVVNEPPRGLGAVSLKHITNFAASEKISLYEAFERSEEISELKPRAMNSAKNFAGLINKHKNALAENKPSGVISDYIEETGILQMYKEMDTNESLDRWNNIHQFLTDMSIFFRENEEATLEDYMQQISLVSDIDVKDTSQNQVKLMTLHAAKGLEFPIVCIAGLEQGIFPLAMADMYPEEEEEERRLFYVGATRAMEKLFLLRAKQRMRFGSIVYNDSSIFLSEIDPKFIKDDSVSSDFLKSVESIRAKRKKTAPKPKSGGFFDDIPKEENYSQIPPEETSVEKGDVVTHSKFGRGKVIATAGVGDKKQAFVVFDSVGKKRLMLKYAKLQKL